MSQTATLAISHFGICTSNIELSERFYIGAFGFELVASLDELGPPYDSLLELPGTEIRVRQLTCGAVKIELIGFNNKTVQGSGKRKAINKLGFTHMTITSSDIEQTLKRVIEFGGEVHEETRVDTDYGPILFCTDPDGVRIEIMGAAE